MKQGGLQLLVKPHPVYPHIWGNRKTFQTFLQKREEVVKLVFEKSYKASSLTTWGVPCWPLGTFLFLTLSCKGVSLPPFQVQKSGQERVKTFLRYLPAREWKGWAPNPAPSEAVSTRFPLHPSFFLQQPRGVNPFTSHSVLLSSSLEGGQDPRCLPPWWC